MLLAVCCSFFYFFSTLKRTYRNCCLFYGYTIICVQCVCTVQLVLLSRALSSFDVHISRLHFANHFSQYLHNYCFLCLCFSSSSLPIYFVIGFCAHLFVCFEAFAHLRIAIHRMRESGVKLDTESYVINFLLICLIFISSHNSISFL